MADRKTKLVVAILLLPVVILLLALAIFGEQGLGMIFSAIEESRITWQERCGNNKDRSQAIEKMVDSGDWSWETAGNKRTKLERVKLRASAQFSASALEWDPVALGQLKNLYEYEYCRERNPYIEIFDETGERLLAVYADRGLYDCTQLELVREEVLSLVSQDYWEGIETMGENWRGNPYLKLHVYQKFQETYPTGAENDRFLYILPLLAVCTGHDTKIYYGRGFTIGNSYSASAESVRKHLKSLSEKDL